LRHILFTTYRTILIIPNVHLHVDIEELRAQASDFILGDLLPSQMQDFSA